MTAAVTALVAQSTEVNVAQNVGFGIIAAIMIFAALSVVTTRKIVHAALWLAVVLGGVAAQYILAAAEFVALSQVLVYIGAVMVLFLFGIMLTRAAITPDVGVNNRGWGVGIPVAVGLFVLLAIVVIDAFEDSVIAEPEGSEIASATEAISDAYLGDYLVPLIALSFVLLAAAIGAIVLARKD